MLKRLIQWFKSFFSSPKVKATETSGPDFGPKPPVYTPDRLDTKEGWEAWRNSFVPSTRSFIPTWEEKLERDARLQASLGPAVDRSGTYITEAKGWEVRNAYGNTGPVTYVLGKPGTVIVTGYAGSKVYEVNGEGCFDYRHFLNQSGSITLDVKTQGGQDYRVQVV